MKNISEGSTYPTGWCCWGFIVPFRREIVIPLRLYLKLELPVWRYGSWESWEKQTIETNWRKLILVVTWSLWLDESKLQRDPIYFYWEKHEKNLW